ncbi:hydroxymethylglutaryl-CoA lyase [Pseudomonas fluorescens]|nr:hydroxymethylglutaryl-CoA lyase [Pseudomonas fluorescens]
MNESIVINEVGLRDGLQNQPELVSTDDKFRLLEALLDAGIQHVEVTSFVNPKAVPQMADAAELYRRLPQRPGVTYSALVANLRGCERALAAGVRRLNVALAATDGMNRRNINMSLTEAKAETEEIIRFGRDHDMTVNAYVATAFGCPYDGQVQPGVVEDLVARLFAAGANEVIVADTIGTAGPFEVARMMGRLVGRHGAAALSVHFHDTKGLAAANSYAAYQQGIRRFDSSIGGLGGCPFAPGARGNAATEELVNLFESAGIETGIDLDKLVAAVAVAEQCIKKTSGSRWIAWRRGAKTESCS